MAMFQQGVLQCWAACPGQQRQQQQQQQQQQLPVPPHPMKAVFVMQDGSQLQPAQPACQVQFQPMPGSQPMRPSQAMRTAPAVWQPTSSHTSTVAQGLHSNPPPPCVLAPAATAALRNNRHHTSPADVVASAAPSAASAGANSPAELASAAVGAAEVLAAVESLYKDNLRPYGRIVRKRLGELSEAAGQGAVEIDAKRLRSLCEGCTRLVVQNEEGGDWSTLLVGRADVFVDVYSPQDLYPPEMWREASAYFEGLGDDQMALPGGRYSCAQELMGRDLGFLSGRSLGEISHIVQLAISQKKLLGYLSGAVVPYHRSQSMIKEQCASSQRPCAGAPARRAPAQGVATWDMVRVFLEGAMSGVSLSTGFIPLSNIKRLFRSRLRAELSETALGYAKLSELLQDPRLRDLCSVRLQGHGYAVFPKAALVATAARTAVGSAPCRSSEVEAPAPPARRGLQLQRRQKTWSPEVDASSPASEASLQQARGLPTLLRCAAAEHESPSGTPCQKPGAERAGEPARAARPRPCALEPCLDGPSTGTTNTPTVNTTDAENLATPCGEANLWTKPLLTPESDCSRRKRSKSLPKNMGSDM